MKRPFAALAVALSLLATAVTLPASAQDRSIVVASTTSTQDSGLFGHLLPLFTAKTGIEVKVIAQGTGHAAMPMSCWCMPGRRRKNSSSMVRA